MQLTIVPKIKTITPNMGLILCKMWKSQNESLSIHPEQGFGNNLY